MAARQGAGPGRVRRTRCGAGEPAAGVPVNQELDLFAGRTIDVPALFIAGKSDWGTYQVPGTFERMQSDACTDMRGAHLVQGAGHWVQQERPRETLDLLLPFVASART